MLGGQALQTFCDYDYRCPTCCPRGAARQAYNSSWIPMDADSRAYFPRTRRARSGHS